MNNNLVYLVRDLNRKKNPVAVDSRDLSRRGIYDISVCGNPSMVIMGMDIKQLNIKINAIKGLNYADGRMPEIYVVKTGSLKKNLNGGSGKKPAD